MCIKNENETFDRSKYRLQILEPFYESFMVVLHSHWSLCLTVVSVEDQTYVGELYTEVGPRFVVPNIFNSPFVEPLYKCINPVQ